MLAGAHPAFDGPVILFQDGIQVLHRSMSAVLLQSALGFELDDGWRITGVSVLMTRGCRVVFAPEAFLW
jgi:hypothetical protein